MSHRKSRARSKPSLQVRIWGDWDLCWRRLLDRSRVQNSSRGKCWTNLRKQLNQSVPFPRSATLSGLDASYYQYYCYVPELKSLSNEFNLTMRRSVMSFLGTTRENIDILSLDISRLTAVEKKQPWIGILKSSSETGVTEERATSAVKLVVAFYMQHTACKPSIYLINSFETQSSTPGVIQVVLW